MTSEELTDALERSITKEGRRGKVVLQHTTGPMAGMFRIMGDAKDAPEPYPEFIAEVDCLDHIAPVSLVAIKRSYVLYRELMDPTRNKHFDKEQR